MTPDLPGYIPPSIIGAPLDFRWEGARDHIGPTETVTPLLDMLASTTMTAQIAMCAGVLTWGAWRLKGETEVEHNFELVEAAFAYMIDCDMSIATRVRRAKPPISPRQYRR